MVFGSVSDSAAFEIPVEESARGSINLAATQFHETEESRRTKDLLCFVLVARIVLRRMVI
jgi:hypothetical protein